MCNATHGTRRYFQSLASPSQAPQLSEKSPAPRPGVRSPSPVIDEAQNHKRKYLRLLAKRQKNEKSENNMQVGGHAREEAKDSVVSFTMNGLLEFQHRVRDYAELQPGPQVERKRPNYNNSKRSFLAKGRVPSHHEPLVCATVSFFKRNAQAFAFNCVGFCWVQPNILKIFFCCQGNLLMACLEIA